MDRKLEHTAGDKHTFTAYLQEMTHSLNHTHSSHIYYSSLRHYCTTVGSGTFFREADQNVESTLFPSIHEEIQSTRDKGRGGKVSPIKFERDAV